MLATGVEGRLVLLLSVAVTLLVLAAGSAATPRKSSQDQYEQQPRDVGRATYTADGDNTQEQQQNHHHHHQQQQLLQHRVQLGLTGLHRFNLLPTTPHKYANKVPELQVGCAEGSVDVRHEPSRGTEAKQRDAVKDDDVSIAFVKKSLNARYKRQTDNRREARNYINWYGSSGTQVQQPQVFSNYHLASPLPYYVPVWGNPRRIPVFFPAKPILFNPGYPQRNPPGVNPATGGMTGLATEAPVSEDGTPITIGNRIGEDDDRPVWGVVESDQPAMAPTAQPPRRKPSPPLLHRPSMTESAAASQFQTEAPIFIDELQSNFRPQTTTTIPPPPAAQGSGRNPTGGNTVEPNRCVWAIISCCSPASQEVRYNCFERLGCPGAFWDNSPCSRDVTIAALNAAQKFYDQS